MSSRRHPVNRALYVAAILSLGAARIAFADDSSMSRFGGDSYAYFNRQPTAASPDAAWRRSHPGGFTERELQALSSSSLSAAASTLAPPVFATAAADPLWRDAHPRGLTEREFQALSSSALAHWQAADAGEPVPKPGSFLARVASLIHPERAGPAAPR